MDLFAGEEKGFLTKQRHNPPATKQANRHHRVEEFLRMRRRLCPRADVGSPQGHDLTASNLDSREKAYFIPHGGGASMKLPLIFERRGPGQTGSQTMLEIRFCYHHLLVIGRQRFCASSYSHQIHGVGLKERAVSIRIKGARRPSWQKKGPRPAGSPGGKQKKERRKNRATKAPQEAPKKKKNHLGKSFKKKGRGLS